MKKIFENKTIMLLVAFVLGAIVMDYYNYTVAKDLNYTKRSGLFKYNEKPIG